MPSLDLALADVKAVLEELRLWAPQAPHNVRVSVVVGLHYPSVAAQLGLPSARP